MTYRKIRENYKSKVMYSCNVASDSKPDKELLH